MLRFLLLAATALLAAAQCPVFDVKPSLRKTVAGGKVAQLTVKVTNRDLAVTNGGFGLALPNGVTYKSVRVSPKLSPAPVFQQQNNQVAWTGINMPVGKTRTFRVKLAFDQCAGTTAVPSKHNKTTNLFSTDIDIGTFTGPVNNQQCLTTKTVKATVRRPKTATNCPPPVPPSPPVFCILGDCPGVTYISTSSTQMQCLSDCMAQYPSYRYSLYDMSGPNVYRCGCAPSCASRIPSTDISMYAYGGATCPP